MRAGLCSRGNSFGHVGPGAATGAHCRAQAVAVLALEHKDGWLRGHWGGYSSRASAIAVRICDENSALAPDTALDAMEADLS
jgi:hypothetical protein